MIAAKQSTLNIIAARFKEPFRLRFSAFFAKTGGAGEARRTARSGPEMPFAAQPCLDDEELVGGVVVSLIMGDRRRILVAFLKLPCNL